MNKKIALCAALAAAATGAAAQSSVTLFGTVDIGLTHLRASGSSVTGLSHSGANISRFGFRGTEDLGGGLAAGFWLEAGFNPDDGAGPRGSAISFNRRATLSLSGPFGEVRMGRDDAATFLNTLIFDPFLTNGVGGTMSFVMLGAPIQVSNTISYFTPPGLGGFYGQIQYAPGEQVANDGHGTSAGDYAGARLGYQNGPWHAALAVGKMKAAKFTDPDLKIRNAGLAYDFGVVRPMLLWAQEKRGQQSIRALELGATIPVGAGVIKLQASRYDVSGPGIRDGNADWRKYAIGYGHNLSKRTQVYTSYARLHNAPGAQRVVAAQGVTPITNRPGGRSHGYEVGIRHFF